MAEEKPVADERLPDEAKVRRYLLGRCSPEEEKEIELSIFGEGAQPILEVVEDELIEDYITGSLDHSDRSHFERRLLCSQAVAEKMMLVVRLRYGQDVAENLGTRIAALTQRFQGRDAAALWNEAVRDVNRSIPHFLGRGSGPALRPLPTSAGPSSRTKTKIRIAAGIAAGMLICAALFLRRHGGHETVSLPPDTRGRQARSGGDRAAGSQAVLPVQSDTSPASRSPWTFGLPPDNTRGRQAQSGGDCAFGSQAALPVQSDTSPASGSSGTLGLPSDTTRGRQAQSGGDCAFGSQAALPVQSDTSPASGSSASIEAVIYMRRSTTEKQVEGFRSSVLEPKNEIPSFVSSYELLSPNQADGHWAIVITFRDKSRRGEVAGYVERIKRDGRVDYVKMSVGPSKKHP